MSRAGFNIAGFFGCCVGLWLKTVCERQPSFGAQKRLSAMGKLSLLVRSLSSSSLRKQFFILSLMYRRLYIVV
ncbi:hypothetical protein, partial [Psychrobacter celer]|uniref:hypothetical protein n=1 Tax=Psychrobacter celer TaxID=306572 RepID=UPI003FD55F54